MTITDVRRLKAFSHHDLDKLLKRVNHYLHHGGWILHGNMHVTPATDGQLYTQVLGCITERWTYAEQMDQQESRPDKPPNHNSEGIA